MAALYHQELTYLFSAHILLWVYSLLSVTGGVVEKLTSLIPNVMVDTHSTIVGSRMTV